MTDTWWWWWRRRCNYIKKPFTDIKLSICGTEAGLCSVWRHLNIISCHLKGCFPLWLMMGIAGAAVHKLLSRVQHSSAEHRPSWGWRCTTLPPCSAGTEGKLTLDLSCANNMTHLERTGGGGLLIVSRNVLFVKRANAWAAGRQRTLCDNPTFCKTTQLLVSYYFVRGWFLMDATKTILRPTEFGNLLTNCWIKRDQLDVTCFIISLFNAQHVSDVNTSILRSLRLILWVISWVVLLWFDVRWCYVVVWLGWCGIRMQASACIHRTRAIQPMK